MLKEILKIEIEWFKIYFLRNKKKIYKWRVYESYLEYFHNISCDSWIIFCISKWSDQNIQILSVIGILKKEIYLKVQRYERILIYYVYYENIFLMPELKRINLFELFSFSESHSEYNQFIIQLFLFTLFVPWFFKNIIYFIQFFLYFKNFWKISIFSLFFMNVIFLYIFK